MLKMLKFQSKQLGYNESSFYVETGVGHFNLDAWKVSWSYRFFSQDMAVGI